MKIAIIGAGAIGSTLGALLARQGENVALVGRPAHVAAICRDGLQVNGQLGEFTVQVKAAERLDFHPDLVLLTVKTQDVVAAVQENLNYLMGMPVVTVQNGVRSDELVASLLPRSQLLSAVVRVSATYLSPGRVTLLDRGVLVLGRPFGPRDAQVDKVAHVLNQAVPTYVSDNIQGAHWLKLLVNLNNALPALTNCPMSQVTVDPYLSRWGVGMLREGLEVTDRAGIRLAGLPQMPVSLFRLMAWVPIGASSRMFASMAGRLEAHGPLLGSTLQSLRRGRLTEIDYLNGEVVQLGPKIGALTPLNAKIVELVHDVERTGQFLSTDAIQQAMRGGNS